MLCRPRHRFRLLMAAALLGLSAPGQAADTAFPFGTELMLDVEPLYGSKRIPMIEIEKIGRAHV